MEPSEEDKSEAVAETTCESQPQLTDEQLQPSDEGVSAQEHKKRGDADLQTGNFGKAVVEYSKAILLKPDFVEAYNMRGAILQQVDPDQASQDYTKCIELQPDNAAFYYARGTLLNNLSENERALQDFGKAIELNPLYVEAHNNKGLIYLETNQLKQALDEFNKALEVRPTHHASLINRANVYKSMKQFDLAFADFEKAIQSEDVSNSAEAYHYRASLHLTIGNLEETLNDYSKEIELRPLFSPAYICRAQIYLMRKQLIPSLKDINMAIKLSPEDTDGYFFRAQVLEAIGQILPALNDYCRIIQLQPDNYKAYIKRGIICETLNKDALALQNFNKAIELSPDYPESYFYRGLLFQKVGELQESLKDRRKVVELQPTFADAYVNLGTLLHKLGFIEEAMSSYSKAIELAPNSPLGYCDRGAQYYRMGQMVKALADLNKAIELDPTNAVAYNNRGSLFDDIREFQLALKDLNTAIELSPEYGNAYYNRGVIFENLGERQLALKDYTKCLSILPTYVQAVIKRARLYIAKKEPSKAIEDMSMAIKLRPHSFFYLISRSLLYYQHENDSSKCVEDLLQARTLLDCNELEEKVSVDLLTLMKNQLAQIFAILKQVIEANSTMKARKNLKIKFVNTAKLFLFLCLKRLEAMQQKNFMNMTKEHEAFEKFEKIYKGSWAIVQGANSSAHLIDKYINHETGLFTNAYNHFVERFRNTEQVKLMQQQNQPQYTYALSLAQMLYIKCKGLELLSSGLFKRNRFNTDMANGRTLLDYILSMVTVSGLGLHMEKLIVAIGIHINTNGVLSGGMKQRLAEFTHTNTKNSVNFDSTLISAVVEVATNDSKAEEIKIVATPGRRLRELAEKTSKEAYIFNENIGNAIKKEIMDSLQTEEVVGNRMKLLASKDVITFTRSVLTSSHSKPFNRIIAEDIQVSFDFEEPETPTTAHQPSN